MKYLVRLTVLGLCLLLAIVTGHAMLALSPAPIHLLGQVNAELKASGVSHPVTAVLLNYRGYDTLLEIAVLLLAVIGVLVANGAMPKERRHIPGRPQPLLQSLARLIVPLMILVAGYLLWAGSTRPGGAFQAGAVLAASIVLLYLSQLAAAWAAPGRLLRLGLSGGFLAFLIIAATLLTQGALLRYPPAQAGLLILCIEAFLSVSLGLILAALIFWLPNEDEEDA